MNGFFGKRSKSFWVEAALALLVLAGLIRAWLYFRANGYLPQPFFYDPNDTWADWINVSNWARDNGTYDAWGTIYPPLSFVFLRIFGADKCYGFSDMGGGRDCDWLGVGTMYGFYVLNIFLVGKSFYKVDRETWLPRTFSLCCGLPMLFGLDRGNLLIICFTCYVLAYGPLVRSAKLRWLSIGLAINLKIYLIASIFPQLLRRRWRWFEGALFAAIIVYIVTYGIYGLGLPTELYENVQAFTGVYQAINYLDLWYSFTYTPTLSLLNGPVFPTIFVLGSWTIDFWSFMLPAALHTVQATIILACAATWLRPERVPMFRLTNMATSFALITAEAGGYTQILVIFLTLMERQRGIGRRWAVLVCYILCIPFDFVMTRIDPLTRFGYLANRPIFLDYAMSYGPFVRPGLIMSIPFALACVTIRQVWLDIREQGWKDRYRYRFDTPIMTGGGNRVETGGTAIA